MRLSRSFSLASVFLALLSGVGALTRSVPAMQQSVPPTPTRPPVFRGSAALVPITVSAVDRSGVPVTDLKEEDFVVYEDGREQKIVTFYQGALVGREAQSSSILSRAAATPVVPNSVRTFLLALGHGRIEEPLQTLDGLISFVRDRLLPGDQVSVMAFHRVTTFTADRAAVVQILERFKSHHERLSAEVQEFLRRTRGIAIGRFSRTGPPLPPELLARIDKDVFGGNTRGGNQLSLRTTSELLLSIGPLVGIRMSGRPIQTFKDLQRVVVDSGYNLNDATVLRTQLKFLAGVEYLRYVNGERHLILIGRDPIAVSVDGARAFARRANEAGIAVDYLWTAGTPGCLQCRDLSELTGGYYNSMQYAVNALATLDAVSRASYLIGYSPSPSDSKGAYRTINVKVRRPGVFLRYRTGYQAPAADDPATLKEQAVESRLSAALEYELPASGIPVQAAASASRVGPTKVEVRVEVAIDASTLLVDAPLNGFRRLAMKMYFGDATGKLIATSADDVVVPVSVVAPSTSRPEPTRKVLVTTLPTVPASVKVVVYDSESDRVGSVVVPLTMVRAGDRSNSVQ